MGENQEHIGISSSRLHHMLGVAESMRERAHLLALDGQEMFVLGFLHDIGYAFAFDGHGELGGAILRNVGFEYADAVACHNDPDVSGKMDSPALLLLQWCIMTTGPDGESWTMDECISDIEQRFGTDGEPATKARRMRKRLLACPVIAAYEKQGGFRHVAHSDIDLHMHSSCSDGTDDPIALLLKARALRMRAFSICDHDTIAAVSVLKKAHPEAFDPSAGTRFIPGVELSCFNELGKYHILGLGYDETAASMLEMVESLSSKRKKKLLLRLEGIERRFGITFDGDVVSEWLGKDSVGKPHIANELVRMGCAADKQSAIEEYIKPADTDFNARAEARDAIGAIHSSGGLAVWAHPLGGIGSTILYPSEFEERLRILIQDGLDGLECHYPSYSAAQQDYLVQTARRYGMLVSCGSDYHGENKDVGIGEMGHDVAIPQVEDISVMDALLRR